MATWRLIQPKLHVYLWWELIIRITIISVFIVTEKIPAFLRVIQPEEEWLYKYPMTTPYVSTDMAYAIVVVSAIGVALIFFAIKRNFLEFLVSILTASLALPLNGLLTNAIKLSVGRPRPDYFDRCYPGQKVFNSSLPCTGDIDDIIEGRKSFPSGHSSMSFCTATFVALFIAGQLGTFNRRGRGQSWRLLLFLLPFMCSTMIAVSRTMDYHHHWQDVTVGGLIGILIGFLVYRQYYPSILSGHSSSPYFSIPDGYEWYEPVLPINDVRTPLLHRSYASSSASSLKGSSSDTIKSV